MSAEQWRRRAVSVFAAATLVLGGCATSPTTVPSAPEQPSAPAPRNIPVVPQPTPEADGFPAPSTIPPDVAHTPDAIPKPEPKSAFGNPDEYEAFGKIYHVLDSAQGFTQTGYASWYGRKFQGKRTASGERYDMFKMTAAHKTLPIPSYVRVTNLENGKSCIVRINDRGPFHGGRIIDLSYAAAARLGMLSDGSAKVRIAAITPGADAVTPVPGRYLQAGAFDDPVGAVAMRERLTALGVRPVELTNDADGDRVIHRVLIGPFTDAAALQALQARLEAANIDTRPVSR